MQTTVYYNGDFSKPFSLEESNDLFILRVAKGKRPDEVLASIPSIQPYLNDFRIRARFPDSDAYVYRCVNKSSDFRDNVKQLIKTSGSPDVIYAGSVFKFIDTDIYQVYTENIFLKFYDTVPESFIRSFLERYDLDIKRQLSFGDKNYFLEARTSHGHDIFSFCEELLNNSEVELCHPEMVSQLKRTNRSFPLENQLSPQLDKNWWLKRTGVPEAWKHSEGITSTIAIIDDGLALDHIAFKGRILYPRDMMNPSATTFLNQSFDDGHGTSCASVACSSDSLALGVAPKASLIPIRSTGLGSVLQSEAIYYAVSKGADVISCSWGPPDGDPLSSNHKMVEYPLPDHTRLAFEYATKHGRNGKGTPIVFAAGNGKELVKYDGYASSEYVIAVSAINHVDKPTIYSDYGPPTYCTFPSGDFEIGPDKNPVNATGIFAASSLPEQYTLFSGTSASCPGVAGAIALMYDLNPELRIEQVKELIKRSCEKIQLTDNNSREYFGNGLLRVDKAVLNTINEITPRSNPNIMENQNKDAVSLHIGINNVSKAYYGDNVPALGGCVNDMKSMQTLAAQIGYTTNTLIDEQATREKITSMITDLGNSVNDGGILLITYAGHGAPIKNTAGDSDDVEDNLDGNDEAWVTYNGFLLDDEIFTALAAIKNKIRVVVVSDSCFSESMTREILPPGVFVRSIDSAAVARVLKRNNTTARDLKQRTPSRGSQRYEVYVKALSACGKNETAKEVRGGGVYTTALKKVYEQVKGKSGLTYQDFVDQIAGEIKVYQRPTVENSHNEDKAFDSQFPFDPRSVTLTATGTQPKTEAVQNSTPPSGEIQLFFETGTLFLESKSNDQKTKQKRGAGGKSRALKMRSQREGSGWDEAYKYLLSNSTTISFVEPETVSCLHYTTDPATDSARDIGNYLNTYPDPVNYGSPVPFIWHLDDDHSQLATAARAVFPELSHGARTATTTDLVKIGHIDTGYLPNHPALPLNIDLANATRFNLGDDTAVDYSILPFIEQQGHGNATMSILAGNWVDVDITECSYKGFYGAIPYARVLPIKISENVVLLSGQNFAQAVDYAIAQGCDVITMSMGGLPSKVMAKAVNRAYEAGIVLVSAAGNNFTQGAGVVLPKRTLYPARYDRVIAATGAAIDKKPYLNEYHQDNTRSAGGLYMQTCYGPENVWPTTIGAFTPNVSWFNKLSSNDDNSYYVKSGGGTSSATPQIAAAAALYIQKYKAELSEFKGENAWKKAEIVRQALFASCDKSTDYNFVYGRGLLKANDVLDPKYAPSQFKDKVTKAEEAPEKRRFLGGLIGVYFNRSLNVQNNKDLQESLEDMMVTEITQLMHKDPELFPYLDSVKLDAEEFSLHSPGLIEKIVQSKYASDFLKSQLSILHKSDQSSVKATNDEFNNRYFAGKKGDIRISARGVNFSVNNKKSYKEYHKGVAVWIDEFELELQSSRDLASGADRELQIDASAENMESAMLLEKIYEDGVVVEWKSNALDSLPGDDVIVDNTASTSRSVYNFSSRDLQSGERGLFDGIKKIVVKIAKWAVGKIIPKTQDALNQLVEPLGDNKYEIMVFDLDSPDNDMSIVWRNIETINPDEIYQSIQNENKTLLLTLPGLFSIVEKGFDEFLESANVRARLRENHCRYILGLNMPTVVHSVEENARRLDEMLKTKFNQPKSCNVLARSRGGIVARYLFEVTWAGGNKPLALQKLVMFGVPNQGTMIASSANWKTFFNYTTNIARLTLGTVVPVLPTILTAIKAIGLGFVDLPGINDLEEDSDLIKKLNSSPVNTGNYFVFTSNFEPNQKLLQRLIDQFLIDKAVFHGELNDGVTPVPGAVFKSTKVPGNIVHIADAQCSISDPAKQVSHFTYLHPEHPEIIERLFTII